MLPIALSFFSPGTKLPTTSALRFNCCREEIGALIENTFLPFLSEFCHENVPIAREQLAGLSTVPWKRNCIDMEMVFWEEIWKWKDLFPEKAFSCKCSFLFYTEARSVLLLALNLFKRETFSLHTDSTTAVEVLLWKWKWMWKWKIFCWNLIF